MTGKNSWLGLVIAVVVFVAMESTVFAQINPRDVPLVAQPQQRFDRGQDVQPIFEGWTRNSDGSYLFHFGYLNRNYREQPSVEIGPDNYFSPGGQDRGQPAYFYPRTQRYQFVVEMPADTGLSVEDGIVWHLTVNGNEQVAYGWLQPEWEIDANTITSNSRTGFGRPVDQIYNNQPPTVEIQVSSTDVSIGETVTLTAAITDDELPTQLRPRTPRSRPPTLVPPDGQASNPDNVRWYRKPRPPRNGISVHWSVYRGPEGGDFEPDGFQRSFEEPEFDEDVDGAATTPTSSDTPATHLDGDGFTSATFETAVSFEEPGDYTLRAWVSDAMLLVPADVVIRVR